MTVYIPTIIATCCSLINIPGVLDSRVFPLVSMVFCFLIAMACAIVNTKTHENGKRTHEMSKRIY